MNWITILQFFACGFALIIGVFAGAAAMALAVRKGDQKTRDEVLAHNTRVEDRLAKYVERLPTVLALNGILAGREQHGCYSLSDLKDQTNAAVMSKDLVRALHQTEGKW